jgi:hypothetical protein
MEEARALSKMLLACHRQWKGRMSNPLGFFLPLILVATRSLTLGIRSPSKLGSRTMVSAEKEYEVLTLVAFRLLGSLVALNLMVRFPDCGAVRAGSENLHRTISGVSA